MTEKQDQALAALASAFDKCATAGLCFYGIDSNLYAAENEATRFINGKCMTLDEIKRRQLSLARVNTHGTYRDSGGF
jgi:hypothetical protein